MIKQWITGLAFFAVGSAYAANEVNFIEAESFSRGGCYGCSQFDGTIEVQNIAYHKDINVVVTNDDGSISELPASYASTAANGLERWAFSSVIAAWDAQPVSFYVEYSVNGETYIDNNGGFEYSVTSGWMFGETSAVELETLTKSPEYSECPSSGCERVAGSVIVENVAYDKSVTIQYEAYNGYQGEIVASYAESLPGNKERWTFNEVFASSQPKVAYFKVVYEVDGVVYGDSNNGFDYGQTARHTLDFFGNPDNGIGAIDAAEFYQTGCYGCTTVEGTVDLKNIAYHKDVQVSYVLATNDGDEVTVPMEVSYQEGPFANGYERWSFSSGFIANVEQPLYVIVTYSVDGRTFYEVAPL